MFKRILLIIGVMFWLNSHAQVPATESTLSPMEQHGKIYVVLAVCLIILSGLFLYLWNLDKRISKLEQQKD
jgi:hypothetical protein